MFAVWCLLDDCGTGKYLITNKERKIMAKLIKETPVLYGKEATRFLREVTVNVKRDHSASYARAQAVYDRFTQKAPSTGHAHAHAR